MQDANEYYKHLLQLFLENNCSPEQTEELMHFLQQDVRGKILLQQLQDEFKMAFRENKMVEPEISERVKNKLLQAINPAGSIPFYKKRFFWWAAAAVLVSFTIGSYRLLFSGSPRSIATVSKQNQSLKNDVLPGGNKASLMLADGSSITLDSAQNGSLTKQGNTNVLKLKNGQLAYNTNNPTKSEPLYNTLTTPRGGQYQLILADGTKVWLNAASSITFPTAFSGTQRKVAITGEVYFEVAKNAAMPFIVTRVNDDAQVKVLGTHFNINAYENETTMKITLLEGSVDVSKNNRHSLLSPGQQAILADEKTGVSDHADLDEVMAWKNGRFYFEGANIKLIMRQIERWYNVDVQYAGDINYSFVANISRDVPVSKLLGILELTNLVHFKIEGNKIIVTP